MNLRDTAERIFWTFVAGALSSLGVGELLSLDLALWQTAALAGGAAVANLVLLIARARLAVLPAPGEGLPGLPAERGAGDIVLGLLVAILILTFLTCARVFGWI